MKRVISIFIAVVSLLVVMVSATSCSAKKLWEQLICEHKYDLEKILEDPTCSKEGKKELTCILCGNVAKEKIEKSEHEYEIIPKKDSTCNETGLTDYKKCIVCGFIEVEPVVIPVKGHTIVHQDEVKATCLEGGLTSGKYCSLCNEVFESQKYISPLNHSLVVRKGRPATCQQAGLTDGVYCENCNEVYNEQLEIPSLDHTDLDSDNICDVCGDVTYDAKLALYNTSDVIQSDPVEGQNFNEPFVLRLYRRNYTNDMGIENEETYMSVDSETGYLGLYLLVSKPERIFQVEHDGDFVSISFTGEFGYKDYGAYVDFYIGNTFSFIVTKTTMDMYNNVSEVTETINISGLKNFNLITPVESGNIKILSLSN